MIALIVALSSLLDRMRGDSWGPGGALEAAVMGAVLALLVTSDPRMVWLIGVLWALGAAPGWGNPVGAALNSRPMSNNWEWWQVGPTRRWVYLALAVRGFIWGAPLLALHAAVPGVDKITLAVTVSMPLSCYIMSHFNVEKRWKKMEYVRGALTASITFAALTLLG